MSSSPSTFGPAPARWPVWLCYGGMMCLSVSVNLPPVYLTTFGEVFGGAAGLTSEQLGRVPGLTFTGVVVGLLAGGALADRWGVKLFALLGLVTVCGGLTLLAGSASYGMVLLACATMGFGSGVLDMVLSPIVCALRPERKASALNWLHAFYCVGAVCTVLIGSVAIRLGIPWRAVALGITVMPIAMFAGFIRLRAPALVQHEERRERGRVLIRRGYFVLALVVIMLAGCTEAAMVQWLPAYAETGLGFSKATGAASLAAFNVLMALGRMGTGILERHTRPIGLMMVFCAGCIALYLTACFAPIPSVALGACVGIGLGISCLWPTTLGIAANRFPRGGASMFAMLTAAGNAGCLSMPWLVGLIAGRTSLNIGLATAALCPALMIGLLLLFPRRSGP